MNINNMKELWEIKEVIGFKGIRRLKNINKSVSPLIKGFIATQTISALQHLKVFEALSSGPMTASEISRKFSLKDSVLEPILEYLYCVGVLERNEDKYAISSDGQFLTLDPHGFFALYTAYGPIFANLPALLRGEKVYGKEINRNETLMAVGSSQIVQVLPIPALLKWLSNYKCKTLLDVGCGAGDFLAMVNDHIRADKLIGIDRSEEVIGVARGRNPGKPNRAKIDYFVMDAISDDLFKIPTAPDIITIMFVLHEIAFGGVENVVKLLRNFRTRFPEALLFVCEVGRTNIKLRRQYKKSGNELHLYHALSNQKLMTRDEWEDIFSQAGYGVREKRIFNFMSQMYFVLEATK